MSAVEPPFRPRVERLLKTLYPIDRIPFASFGAEERSASWTPEQSELWSTCGQWDRLTQLVLGAHQQRIQVALLSDRYDPGFRITLTSRGFAPEDPSIHHPGLADLASRCYGMVNRVSPTDQVASMAALLKRALPLVVLALMGIDTDDEPADYALVNDIESILKENA